jgi:uncharacterized protein YbjT (DUF2867 family)
LACGGKREENGVILVTGATGRVGRQLVTQLTEHGAAVRAVARDPDAAGLPAGVEVVRADLADAGSLDAHLAGVDAAFLLWPFTSPSAAAELAPGVVNAIARQVPRIVYLSAHAAADRPDSFWAQVEHLVEASAAEWTFLRPAGFAANALIWADQIRAGDVVRWPYGAAARSLVHERDLASVARLALTEDGHAGARYVLTGPSRLTQAEQVQAIGMAIGRQLRWEELPRDAARKQLVALFGDAAFADSALSTWAEFVRKPEILTTTVQEITGTPARSFGQWAADHADDFR